MGMPTESYLSQQYQSNFGQQQMNALAQQQLNYTYQELMRMQQAGSQQNIPGSLTYYKNNHEVYKEEVKPVLKGSFMDSLRNYLNNHKDLIYTLILAFLADHYVLGGAFREKIKAVVEKLLDKAQQKIGK